MYIEHKNDSYTYYEGENIIEDDNEYADTKATYIMKAKCKKEENPALQIAPTPLNNFDNIINYASNLKLIIDIQNSMKAQNSIGYKKWAEKFNLEQMSQTLIFTEKHQPNENLKQCKTSKVKLKHLTKN